MEEVLEDNLDPMSELGEWKDCIGYPLYQLSSTGVFMNKRTLKILKHFHHKESDDTCITLYRRGKKGDILSVKLLLLLHFGKDAILPEVVYRNNRNNNEGHIDEDGFCKFCGWNSVFPESHIIWSGEGQKCKYIKKLFGNDV